MQMRMMEHLSHSENMHRELPEWLSVNLISTPDLRLAMTGGDPAGLANIPTISNPRRISRRAENFRDLVKK
jgi:hypothetical protein